MLHTKIHENLPVGSGEEDFFLGFNIMGMAAIMVM